MVSTPSIAALETALLPLGRVLLGYSGGVDSSLLAVVAGRLLGEERFLAVIGVSPSLGSRQHQVARDLARRYRFPLRELSTDELGDPDYAANPENRCYFCKRALWRRLGDVAVAEGWDTIADGTNADDLGEHRPGALAGAERQVATPLADLGWGKVEVRRLARELGLPTWDAPAAPCLASRLATGVAVSETRLAQVAAGEEFLRQLGVTGDLRVRHLGTRARVEVSEEMLPLVRESMPQLVRRLLDLGFAEVDREPRAYRRGSLSTPVAAA